MELNKKIIVLAVAILTVGFATAAKASGPTPCMIDGTCDAENQPIDTKDDSVYPATIPTDSTPAPVVKYQEPAALPTTGMGQVVIPTILILFGLYAIRRATK